MSNFICSECGMTNIDCGSSGYKTPKEIELEAENKKLKKQLAEANRLISSYANYDKWANPKQILFIDDKTDLPNEKPALKYLKRWGVK